MVSTVQDVTAAFNANGLYTVDLSNWDYCVVQLVSPTGTITFNSTNDGGAVTGVTDGNALSVGNLIAVQATNLNTGAATTTGASSGLYKFGVIGRYLQLTGASVTATKILLYLTKIS